MGVARGERGKTDMEHSFRLNQTSHVEAGRPGSLLLLCGAWDKSVRRILANPWPKPFVGVAEVKADLTRPEKR